MTFYETEICPILMNREMRYSIRDMSHPNGQGDAIFYQTERWPILMTGRYDILSDRNLSHLNGQGDPIFYQTETERDLPS